ncbi:MAG: hypothetical protein KDD55_01160 [Bdellovibrionales bacterium]|nr:hypothetical protein [Bdellovibrionales bacterium]
MSKQNQSSTTRPDSHQGEKDLALPMHGCELAVPTGQQTLSREESSPVQLSVAGISQKEFERFMQRIDFGLSQASLAYLFQSIQHGTPPDVSRFTLDHLENDGEVSLASHAVFSTGNSVVEKFASVVLYDDLNGGTNLKLTLSKSISDPDAPVNFKMEWCEHFLEQYGVQHGMRWDIVDTFFDVIEYRDTDDVLSSLVTDIPLPLTDRINFQVEARTFGREDYLHDPHLARNESLLHFILGNQQLEPTLRAVGQQVRILGMYPTLAHSEDYSVPPPICITEGERDSLSLALQTAQESLSNVIPLVFLQCGSMMLPVTQGTTLEVLEEDIQYLEQIQEEYVEVGKSRSVSLPQGCIYAPEEIAEEDPEFEIKVAKQIEDLTRILEGFGVNGNAELVKTLREAIVYNRPLTESDLLDFIVSPEPVEVIRTTVRNLQAGGFDATTEQIEIRKNTVAGPIRLTLYPHGDPFGDELDIEEVDVEEWEDEELEVEELEDEEDEGWGSSNGFSEGFVAPKEVTTLDLRVSFDLERQPYPSSGTRRMLWEYVDQTARLLGIPVPPEELMILPRVEDSPSEIQLGPSLTFTVHCAMIPQAAIDEPI